MSYNDYCHFIKGILLTFYARYKHKAQKENQSKGIASEKPQIIQGEQIQT